MSAQGPTVSVVVPSWNGRELLRRCLASLRGQTFSAFEVVVVDNGSSDGSAELLRAGFPEARLVALPENVGFARAVNEGIRAARGRYVAILNNDVEVDTSWLRELVVCVERHPRAASVASKVLRADDRGVLDGAGDSMTWSLKAYRRGRGERDRGQYGQEEEVFSASGTACLWRAGALHELGLFDEGLFAYYEDVELGLRARLAGYECWYAPHAVVFHVGGATSGAANEFVWFHSVKNRWSMIVKDAPSRWLVRKGHVIVVGELRAAVRAAREGGLAPLLRAYGDVLARLGALLRARAATAPPGDYGRVRPLISENYPPRRPARRAVVAYPTPSRQPS